jgi:hypothetical protein
VNNTASITLSSSGVTNLSGSIVTIGSSSNAVNIRGNTDLAGTLNTSGKITVAAGRATMARQRADALGWGLIASEGTGTIRLTGWAKNIFDQGLDINTGVAWDATKWYHVVYTWAQTESKMYLNGNLISTKTYASTTGTNDSSNNVDMFSSFGGIFDISKNCNIDEMVVYKTTLTPAQVMNHAVASGVLYQ